MTQEPVDVRQVRPALERNLRGYGLTPSAARERAAVVKAVTADPHIRQRPMPVVVAAALVALGALAVWGWRLYAAWFEEQAVDAVFWIALAVSMAALFVCAWAWELYDLRRALVVSVALIGSAFVAVVVIVVAVAIAKGEDVDLDLPDFGKLLDGGDRGAGGVEGVLRAEPWVAAEAFDDVGPLAVGAIRNLVDPSGASAEEDEATAGTEEASGAAAFAPGPLPPEAAADDPRATACQGCGFRFDLRERLACPRCGRPA